MALKSLLSSTIFSVFTLSILLSHHAFASPVAENTTDQLSGICSIAVTIHGYKCQEFDVTTDDGYILSVQRIPEGRNGGGGGGLNKPPVLLQHGILVDGMTWLLNSPEQSLAMMLADNGFDVWISNLRGTLFSRRHIKLNPRKREFWDWSWDDLAAHDIPSVINFIVKQTGQKPHYAAHSMGTLAALVSLSEGRFQNVKSVALLSPIAYMSHMKSPLAIVAARLFLGEALATLGFAEFDPRGGKVIDFLAGCCAHPGVRCYDMLSAITGQNCCLNSTSDGSVMKHQPQSTSMKNLVHFSQMVRDGAVAKYDYGNAFSNLKHYNAFKPPVYDLSRIPPDFPIFLTYGGKDALANRDDVATLLRILKSHDQDKLQVQYIQDYAHADFIMAVNANRIVYSPIIDFFKSQDQNQKS